MEFLDTNVIIRYLTGDNAEQAQRAYHLFQQVEAGKRLITTCEAVLAEVVYVLSSKVLYNLDRNEIRTHLRTIITLRGLRLSHKTTYLQALDLYVEHPYLSFVDALCAAQAQRTHSSHILSFDRDFDRVPGLMRREPSSGT